MGAKYLVEIEVFDKNDRILYAIEHKMSGKKAKKLINFVKYDSKENGLTPRIHIYELKSVKVSDLK